jgi:hypothetical protein
MRAGAEAAGREYWSFHEEIVRGLIGENYRTIWRALLSLTSDEALVSRASSMAHRVYDRGVVAAKMLSPGRCEMLITEWPAMPDRALHGFRVAIHAILELSRRRGVTVACMRTPDGARFDMRWDA